MTDEYQVRLATMLGRSRTDAMNNVLFGLGFAVFNLLVLHAHTTFVYIFSAILALQVIFGALRRFRLRAGSPIVRALEDPAQLESVYGWPLAGGKYPPGKVPQFLVAKAKTGAKVRLKANVEQELRKFIEQLREVAPEVVIAVPNVEMPKLA